MKYFIAFIGTYEGNKMAAGNTILETSSPIDHQRKIKAVENHIKEEKNLDSVAIINFLEVSI